MFTLTFLGHQGWSISTATTHLLIDPLLTDGFGHGGLLGRLYPPRTLDLARCPPVDAVVVTHEHDDHFDVPSLARLDRSIPIYLSTRSSTAASSFLRELGFEVRALEPDAVLSVGDLRYHSFAADHRGRGHGDEWDVFPLFVDDLAGHGSLLSSIDVASLPSAVPGRPAVWAHAHNSTRVEFQRLGTGAPQTSDDAAQLAAVLQRWATLEACHGAPAVALICGQGWSFAGEQAWIDHEAFPVSPSRVAEVLDHASARTRVFAPAPGFGVTLVDGEVVSVSAAQPWIATRSPETWPARGFAPREGPRPDYGPACGRAELGAGELEGLLAGLEDFARYLYGGAVFRELCSLPTSVDGIASAVGFSVRVDASSTRVVLRYEPSGCRFVPVFGADPERTLLAGIECYATDLLAFVVGELSPSALCYAGRVRTWNLAPSRVRFSPYELWMWGHPLRRPDQALALYRRLFAGEPEAGPRIRGRT